MQEKLDLFEGRDVQISELRLLGSTHERVGQLEQGEEVLIVAKAVVSEVKFRTQRVEHGGEPAMVRSHRAGMVQFFIVPNDQGARWLDEARALADERFGIQDLLTWTGQNGEGDGEGEVRDEGEDGGPDEKQ